MNSVEVKLKNVFNLVFRQEFESYSSLNQDNIAEWDSIRHLDLIMALEEAYNIEIEFDDIALLTSYTFILEFLNENKLDDE